jgi:hypothetical protein
MNLSIPNNLNTTAHSDAVHITLTGTRSSVQATIHLLHELNFIAGSEWSKAIAVKCTNTVICVATRAIRTE